MASARSLNNLDSIGEMLGQLSGMADGLDEDRYIAAVIRDAHEVASKRFDISAAARASTGHLNHVYEFGVPGITRGTPSFTDPTSPSARLYEHTIKGVGGQQNIGYSFRPALARNPQPTTKDTGVPSQYLRRLSKRKYVFYNKAFVMESGQSVSIKSERGDKGLLFVPTPGQNAPRNFVMYPTKLKGAVRTQPGRTSKGTFTAFWLSWWSRAGAEIMESEMRTAISMDIKKAASDAQKAAAAVTVKPASTNNPVGVAAKAKAKAKSLFGRRTKL